MAEVVWFLIGLAVGAGAGIFAYRTYIQRVIKALQQAVDRLKPPTGG